MTGRATLLICHPGYRIESGTGFDRSVGPLGSIVIGASTTFEVTLPIDSGPTRPAQAGMTVSYSRVFVIPDAAKR